MVPPKKPGQSVGHDECCIPHDMMPEGHTILHEIASSSKTVSYLAENERGQRVTLTYVEPERVMERFRLRAHQEGRSVEDGERAAKQWLERFHQQQWNVFHRVEGLHDDHVAEMYKVGADEEKQKMVIVSEYHPGMDLFLATRRLKPLQMLSLFVQCLLGMRFIHSNGLLHLNIKPERIRVDMERKPPLLKLMDFGFAIPKEGYTGEYTGTPLYMASEVACNLRDKIDERADLYSFAVTMYYCLTGHHPYPQRGKVTNKEKLKEIITREGPASPPSHYHRETPAALDSIVLNLLQAHPDERKYKNAGTLLEVIRAGWPDESEGMPTKKTTTVMDYS